MTELQSSSGEFEAWVEDCAVDDCVALDSACDVCDITTPVARTSSSSSVSSALRRWHVKALYPAIAAYYISALWSDALDADGRRARI